MSLSGSSKRSSESLDSSLEDNTPNYNSYYETYASK